jgi:hypothetical protein
MEEQEVTTDALVATPYDGEESSKGFVLTDRDVELLRLIYEHRFLQRDHLAALSERPVKRLHRRIFTLFQNGYLTRIKLPQQRHIYGLGKKALGVLVEQGIGDESLLFARLRAHELKEFFLKHELMIVDIHVALGLASRKGAVKLRDWKEGRELFDKVSAHTERGLVELPIRPDAFFSLEDSRRPVGANRLNFFLEADRSTTTQARFREKLLGYWHYFEQGLHSKKYEVKHVRVVTITLTEARAENLVKLATSLLPERARKYFLFASRTQFSIEHPDPVLDAVFLCPRDSGRVPLVLPPSVNASPST